MGQGRTRTWSPCPLKPPESLLAQAARSRMFFLGKFLLLCSNKIKLSSFIFLEEAAS